MREYRIKKLVSGFKLGKDYAGRQVVAVPEKYLLDGVRVVLDNDYMVLKPEQPPLSSESFADKFGRGEYRLCYYDWKPVKKTGEQQLESMGAFAYYASQRR